MYKKIIFTVIMILIFVSNLNAQQGISTGLGGAYTAIARGPEAVFWNPANLGLSSSLPSFNIKMYSFGFDFGNNVFNIDFYNDYFTGTGETDAEGNKIGKTLTESDKNDILNKIPDDGLELMGKADVSFLAFNYKNFGFSIEGNVFVEMTFPKDAFVMILTDIGEKSYSFDIEGNGFGVGKVNFSYGRAVLKNKVRRIFNRNIKINELAVGATISYLRGAGYAKVTESDVNVNITSTGFNAPSRVVTRVASFGSGFGLDLGVGAVIENEWQMGLVFDNIPGIISWSSDAKENINTFDLEREMYINELEDIDIDDYSKTEDVDLNSFTQTLPLNVRLGVARYYKRYMGNVELARDYGHIRFSLGGGVDLKFIEFYASYGRTRGDNCFSGAVAFNYKYFLWDIGVTNRGGLTGNASKGLAFGSSIRFGF